MLHNIFFLTGISALCIFLTTIILKIKHPIISSILNMSSGIIMLLSMHAIESITQIQMPVSILSTGISATLGIPGVALIAISSLW